MAQAIKAGIRFPRGERAVCLGLRAARKKERALAEGHRGQRPARGERGTPEAARDPPEPWLPFRKSLDSVTPWEVLCLSTSLKAPGAATTALGLPVAAALTRPPQASLELERC